jgi:hypothetical protein
MTKTNRAIDSRLIEALPILEPIMVLLGSKPPSVEDHVLAEELKLVIQYAQNERYDRGQGKGAVTHD